MARGFALAWTVEGGRRHMAGARWLVAHRRRHMAIAMCAEKRASFAAGPFSFSTNHLPDSAGVGSYHLLPGLAAEGVLEFRHVGHHVIDAEDGQGMGIGGHGEARDLGTDVGAPRVGKRQEELLAVGPSIGTFIVERFALLFQVGLEGIEREVDAAVVGSIFPLRE